MPITPFLLRQIRSTIDHDGLVMSVVPFLLSLSAHEEDAIVGRRNNTNAKGHVPVSTESPPSAGTSASTVGGNGVIDLSKESMASS